MIYSEKLYLVFVSRLHVRTYGDTHAYTHTHTHAQTQAHLYVGGIICYLLKGVKLPCQLALEGKNQTYIYSRLNRMRKKADLSENFHAISMKTCKPDIVSPHTK